MLERESLAEVVPLPTSVRKASKPAGSRTRILSGVDIFQFTTALTHSDYQLILTPRNVTAQGGFDSIDSLAYGNAMAVAVTLRSGAKNLKQESDNHVAGTD